MHREGVLGGESEMGSAGSRGSRGRTPVVVVDEGDTDEPDMRLKVALLGSAPDEKIIALAQRFRSQNVTVYQIDPRTDYFTAARRHLDGLFLWVFVTCLPQPFFFAVFTVV